MNYIDIEAVKKEEGEDDIAIVGKEPEDSDINVDVERLGSNMLPPGWSFNSSSSLLLPPPSIQFFYR